MLCVQGILNGIHIYSGGTLFLNHFLQNSEYEYEVSMPATLDVGTRVTGVTWYEVQSTRKADGKGTLVSAL